MADLDRLYDALRKADAAGNADDARAIAQAIRAQTASDKDESAKQVMQVAAGAPTPAASGVERAATAAGMGAKGFADSALEAIGLVPDFVASGFKAVGLPAPADPHFYT